VFPAGYYDAYVSQVWNTYAAGELRVAVNGATATARVSGGLLVFNNGVRSFARPSTRDIFYCDGALASGGTSGPVAAVLGAAFNRSTLHNHPDQPATDAATFYTTAVTNHYARVLHANTADHKAYGFAFDDVAGLAPYVSDPAPTGMRLRLTPFG
jgi:hypothetical protein